MKIIRLIEKVVIFYLGFLLCMMSGTATLYTLDQTTSSKNLSNIIIVDDEGDGNYTDIQTAIDNANIGDIIRVYSGLYAKAIINKQVTLEGIAEEYGSGSDIGKPIIDAGGSGQKGLEVKANDITISGFQIQNAGDVPHACIYILGYSNVNIHHNILYDSLGIGIFLRTSQNCFITNNNFTENGKYGIYLWDDCFDNTIYHNNFFDNNLGTAYDKGRNTWNDTYPSGGNYFDDYTGIDTDYDGIGETSYEIPGATPPNKDHYPYVYPDGWLNQAPDTPNQPNGPTQGIINEQYTYTTDEVIDPNGDPVEYGWDMDGDGEVDYWTATPQINHTWTTGGSYEVRVKARDLFLRSPFSPPLTVTIFEYILEIDEIAGGLFKAQTVIANRGQTPVPDISWTMSATGGILQLINKQSEGTIELLGVGGEEIIAVTPIFGFGVITINVSVAQEALAEPLIQEVKATVIGPFVFHIR